MASVRSSWLGTAPAPPKGIGRGRSMWAGGAAALAAERDRWPLWLPVFLGSGVGLYFSLPSEPSPGWAAAALAASALLAAAGWRRQHVLLAMAVVVATVAAGFGLAQMRTQSVAAPVLERRIGPVQIEGRVRAVEQGEHGRRLVVDRLAIAGLAAGATPDRARLRISEQPRDLWPGDRIVVRAILAPPPEPAMPGAFDFARQAYFERLGGVGFAVGSVRLTERARSAAGFDFDLEIARLRQVVTGRITAALPPSIGGMAASFLTGERAAIPPDVLSVMRDAGLAHLIAISGMNFAMAAGLIFFTLRLLFAAVPPLALRYPVKKWAAGATIVGIAGYYLLSGGTVPTQRAFLMLFAVLVAVIVDRSPISMRLAAWAAAIVIALAPESLLGASFQMSFAAVVALIALYEAMARRFADWRADRGWLRLLAIYLAGVALTTLVAGLATAPFAVYHFNRLPLYGSLIANLLAIPLTAAVVMPAGLAALLLMPFGLEGIALAPMGWGIAAMIEIARWVAAWPGAVALVPAMPPAGLAAIVAGGLWLCLWRGRWRALGLIAAVGGVATMALVRPPDVVVDDTGQNVAARDGSGGYALGAGRGAAFRTETWLRRFGEERFAAWPREGTAADGRLACDARGCLYRAHGQTVAVVRDPAGLADDCRVASVVVSAEPVPRRACRGPAHIIDRFALRRRGAHAIWLSPDGARVETVADRRGERPWSQRRGRDLSSGGRARPAAPAP
jgi:competence protein ComEC